MSARVCTNCGGPRARGGKLGLCATCAHAHMSATRRKDAPVQQTDDYRQSGTKAEVTALVPERVRTLADLIRVCQIDTTEWEVERYVWLQ